MDNSTTISTFCKTLATFCNHLQNSSTALKKSLETRPIPLESASSTFLECLNRRVSSASSDLNLLESMARGTVSFEELLGHCNQLYKKNQTDLVELQDHLKNYGYIPTDDEDDALEAETPSDVDADDGSSLYSRYCAPVSATVDSKSILGKLDDLIDEDESLSLQNFGLSDVCLATIASKSNDEIGNIASPRKPSNYTDGHLMRLQVPSPPRTRLLNMTLGDVAHDSESVVASKTMINISRNDYENLPSFMKSLASWEDMVVIVDKMNSTLNSKDKQECKLFYQEELGTLGLGPKVRSYLLMLLRMNRLVVETVNGSIAYRVL